MQLLVLGGTQFLGRAIVESALARGHQVTLFNRGKTNPGLFEGRAQQVTGDRTDDLGPLAGRYWDAVVDVAAYFPAHVALSVGALGPLTERYLFVSTISVYADHSVPPVEEAPLSELSDPADTSPETYGARKAASEKIVQAALGEKATVVRPGLIVGPFDPTERFSYWPQRIARGGRVLAPGAPGDPLQFIDVRDLGDFIVRLLEKGTPGTFNATGRTVPFDKLLQTCRQVCGGDTELVWVPSTWLLAAGLAPWMGVPLWVAGPDLAGANRVDITKALATGLSSRPLAETVRSALDSPAPRVRTEFSPEQEQQLLQAWANENCRRKVGR